MVTPTATATLPPAVPTAAQAAAIPTPAPVDIEETAMAAAINTYLAGTPLAGQGEAMVAAALRHGIDPRMLPAISRWESTWGRNACGFNPYGYASCAVTFSSWEEAHEVAARTLAGYRGDITSRLSIWNQGHVNGAGLSYAAKVLTEMGRVW